MNEIEEEILTTICNVEFPCSGDCVWCEKITEALIENGYGKVEDYKKQIETDNEYEKNLNNVINKYLEKERTYKKEIERLTKIKTNGDKFRSMSDEDFSRACIVGGSWDSGMLYQSPLTQGTYITFDDAYKENLEWLRQEYKGE